MTAKETVLWGKEYEPYLEFIVYMSTPLHIKGMELYGLSHIECPLFIVAVCWYLWMSVNSLRILFPLKDVRDTIVFKSLSNHHLLCYTSLIRKVESEYFMSTKIVS